jgi:hypothetical protein
LRPKTTRIFRRTKEEVTAEWINLHYEKLNNLYSLGITRRPIIRVTKPSEMRVVGLAAHMRDDEK